MIAGGPASVAILPLREKQFDNQDVSPVLCQKVDLCVRLAKIIQFVTLLQTRNR